MVVLGLLAGCTPGTPQDYGVRLNADGTIDFVDCNGLEGDVVVRFADEVNALFDETALPQWEVRRTKLGRLFSVIEYGTSFSGETTIALDPPPPDWLWVAFGNDPSNSMYVEPRSELVEGEWVWRNDEFWSFVPSHACAEVDG